MDNITAFTGEFHTSSLLEFGNMDSKSAVGKDEPYALPTWVTGVLLALHSVFLLISIGGNTLICILFGLKKQLRTVANYFVISLAFSDIIMVILCVPFTVMTNLIYFHWIFGAFWCPVVGYLQLSSVIQRSFVLVAAAADRHHSIARPMKRHLSKKEALAIISVIWLMSLAIPLPVALFSKLQNIGSEELCVEQWPTTYGRATFDIAMMVITYVVPLGVIFFTYAHIVSILGKKAPGENLAKRDQRRLCTKTKTIRTMIYMVMAYLVCWLPIHVITLIGDLDPAIFNSKTVHVLWLFFHFLAMSNSSSCPLLYFTTDTVYRQNLLGLFKKDTRRDDSDELSEGFLGSMIRRFSVASFADARFTYKRRLTEIIDINLLNRLSPVEQRKVSTLSPVEKRKASKLSPVEHRRVSVAYV